MGLRPAGYRAIESLRLEKGYRAWGADITPNDSPFEAGLGWAVKLRRNMDFMGRAAAEQAASGPLRKRMAGFTTDDAGITLLGRETILRDGEFAGYLSSGGFGYTIGKPVGYGYLRNAGGVSEEWIKAGRYELVVAGERIAAQVWLEPMYDPGMVRPKS
jgi:sarcosine dehydrogenase